MKREFSAKKRTFAECYFALASALGKVGARQHFTTQTASLYGRGATRSDLKKSQLNGILSTRIYGTNEKLVEKPVEKMRKSERFDLRHDSPGHCLAAKLVAEIP